MDYRDAAAACYLEATPESGYIWKPYKQKLCGGNRMCEQADFAWRACWDWQIEKFNGGDLAIGKPTSEMTTNPHLAGQPCLRFTRNSGLLPMFMNTRPGGAILRVDLAELEPEQWQEWPQTLDIHVHAQAVLDHADCGRATQPLNRRYRRICAEPSFRTLNSELRMRQRFYLEARPESGYIWKQYKQKLDCIENDDRKEIG